MKRHSPTANSGFTLIELMVTVSVAAIILSTAVPGFRQLIQNNKVATEINAFVSALHLARSEAIKRGKDVTVCKSADSASCVTTNGWEQGWIAFVDDKATANQVDVGEEILRVYGPLGSGTTLRGNANVVNTVTFRASGFAKLNGSIILCDSRVQTFSTDKALARVAVISTRGRVRLLKGDHADAPDSCTP
jgi:type IV fimbrial biogenesis protein FimT